MSPGCYVGVAGAGPGSGTTPQTKIFSHQCGVILNHWGGVNLPNPLANQTLHMASAEERVYNGVWGSTPSELLSGAAPQCVHRQSRGSGGKALLKL